MGDTCRVTRSFQSQPSIYTTYSRATIFAPRERKLLSFILAKAKPGENVQAVCDRIYKATGLAACTREQFVKLTLNYFMKYTRIPINFGMSVVLGFIIGTAIAGQTFYNFTLDNLRHFGTLKAMGAGNGSLLRMFGHEARMSIVPPSDCRLCRLCWLPIQVLFSLISPLEYVNCH
jgi:putative ABC transport system permease protein